MIISNVSFKNIFIQISSDIEENKIYLSELDRVIGDGDHGSSMSLGWRNIKDKLENIDTTDCGVISKEMAMVFLDKVGASIGPLYGSAFLNGEKVLKGKKELTEHDIIKFWSDFVEGMQKRGGAEVGDKTMMDTWIPFMKVLNKFDDQGKSFLANFNDALKSAEIGKESTKDIVAQKGRSATLKERSIGHIDPGAASAYIILFSFYKSISKIAS